MLLKIYKIYIYVCIYFIIKVYLLRLLIVTHLKCLTIMYIKNIDIFLLSLKIKTYSLFRGRSRPQQSSRLAETFRYTRGGSWG